MTALRKSQVLLFHQLNNRNEKDLLAKRCVPNIRSTRTDSATNIRRKQTIDRLERMVYRAAFQVYAGKGEPLPALTKRELCNEWKAVIHEALVEDDYEFALWYANSRAESAHELNQLREDSEEAISED